MPHAVRALSLFVLLLVSGVAVQAADWRRFVEPEFGARALYPAHVFTPAPRDPEVPGQAFLSGDGEAKLAIGSWRNEAGESPATFRSKLLAEARYASLTYGPRGRSWFVLSGYRGDKIYYEKVMYTCGGKLVSAFAILYPAAERGLYDPIVERMEDHFRPGRRCS